MPDQILASSAEAPNRLTESEWQEISDSSLALSAVCKEFEGRGADPGHFELLESVQRRLGIAVLMVENRIAGQAERPTCGAALKALPDDQEGGTPPDSSSPMDYRKGEADAKPCQ